MLHGIDMDKTPMLDNRDNLPPVKNSGAEVGSSEGATVAQYRCTRALKAAKTVEG